MIPRGISRPSSGESEDFLRKDQVFLLERFYYFLEDREEDGILVMDETDKTDDKRFVSRLHRYFVLTENGRLRSTRIVPAPFFVSSDMQTPIQIADISIYCINWGFRVFSTSSTGEVRQEIQQQFGGWLDRLQYRGRKERAGHEFRTFGIVFVPDPYTPR